MYAIRRKRFFTLLEVLTVLLILSFGILMTGVSINKLYREQIFLSETQQVLGHLTMAQDLMLILDADVKVIFERESAKQDYSLWIDIEKPLNSAQERMVQRKLSLASIKSVKFNGKDENPLILQFSLGSMSRGILELSENGAWIRKSSSDQRIFLVEMPGFPSPFEGEVVHSSDRFQEVQKMKKDLVKEEETESLSEQLFPSEVYDDLQQKEKKANPSQAAFSTP